MENFVFMYKNVCLNAATGIIGGADGPTAIFIAGRLGDSLILWIVGVGIVLALIYIVRMMKKRK